MIELAPAVIEAGKWLLGFLAGSTVATGMAADAAKLAGQLVMTVVGDEVSDRLRGAFGGPGRGDPANRELNHHIEQAYRLAELSALVQFVQRYARHTGAGGAADAYAALASAQGVERLAASYRAVERDAQAAYAGDIGLSDIAAALVSTDEAGWQGMAPAVQALRQRLENRALAEMAHVVDQPAPARFAQAFRQGEGPGLPPWYALLAHSFAAVLLDGRHDQAKESMLLRMVSRAALRVAPHAVDEAAATEALEQRLRDDLRAQGTDLGARLAEAVGRVGDSLGSDLRAVRTELEALSRQSATIAGLVHSVHRGLAHVQQLLEDYGQALHALREDVREVRQRLDAVPPAMPPGTSRPAAPPWHRVPLGTVPAAGAAPIGRDAELDAVAGFAGETGPQAAGLLAVLGRGGSGKTLLLVHALQRQADRLPAGRWPPAVLFLRAVDGDRQLVAAAIAACDRLLAALGHAPVAGNAQFSTVAEKLACVDEALAGEGVQALLVLDSLEAALDATTARPLDEELGELLLFGLHRRAPALRVIVTSQVAPRVKVDALYRPLSQAVSDSVRIVDLGGGLRSAADGVALLRRHDPGGTLGLAAAPDALLEALSRCVGGNPNALKHLAMLLDLDRSLDPPTLLQRLQDEQAVQPEVDELRQHLIGRYFERLPPAQQRLLQALAIQGGQAPLAAAAALLDPADGDAGPLAGELMRRQLLRREGAEHAIHDSERAYYLARLAGSPALPALQRRAADHWATRALPAARWTSHADAQPTLREIALRSRAGQAERAAPARCEAARRLYELGLLSAATQLLLDASAAEQGQPGEADRLAQLALCHWKAGAFAQGLAVCRQALDRWPAAPGATNATLAGLRQTHAACTLETGAVHEAIDAYRRLVAELTQAGVPADPALARVAAQACMDLAFAQSMAGQAQAAIDDGRRAVALCMPPAAPVALPALQAMASGYLATYLTYLPAFDEARNLYHEAILQAVRCEARYELAIVYGLAAELELLDGRPERAASLSRSALAAQKDTDAITGSWCHYLIAQALAGTPDGMAEAREAAETACRFSRPLNDANPRVLLGMLLLRQGHEAEGIEQLQQAVKTTDALVAACAQNWEAWVAQGWALLGLAARGRATAEAALSAYRQAQAASPHPGHFARIRVQLGLSAPVLAPAGLAPLPRIASFYGLPPGTDA
ncbi:hypothetical protein V4F39_11045 [Aquincola sp. MAHUQ-54]|uniref:AAA+ ATPase domain-containing protein n=1 Tax=Aquincola agrisoli TaxID=3119538 RepID=A0AAW9QB39_9BURK